MAKWRRRGGGRGDVSPQALAWNSQEADGMAVSGGVTAAYRCFVLGYDQPGGRLQKEYAPRLRTECATVDDAVRRLLDGATVVVAGCDMAQLRTRLAAHGIG